MGDEGYISSSLVLPNLPKRDEPFTPDRLRTWQDGVHRALQDLNANIYQEVRVSRPEFFTSNATPSIEEDRMGIWYDSSTMKYYVIYNANGTIVKAELT